MKNRGPSRSVYGAIRMDSTDDSESDVTTTFSSSSLSDIGSTWRGERKSLLDRTDFEAKLLGAKRSISTQRGLSVSRSELSSSFTIQRWPWQRMLKVLILTLICIALTTILLFFPEEVLTQRIIEVDNVSPVTISLDDILTNGRKYQDGLLKVSVGGSLLPEELMSVAPERIVLKLTRTSPHNQESKQFWTVGAASQSPLPQITLEHYFNLEGLNWTSENVSLSITTHSLLPIPLLVQFQILSDLVNIGISLGALVLFFMYGLILFEVVHRTIASMLCATLTISILAILDQRPALEEIITWIDIETLTLLFSMMLIVSVMSETGIFNYVGFIAFKITKAKVWPLLFILCFTTAVVSAMLDNVTTILLMTPVIIQLCEEIHVDPRKVLIANVIFSNIGGAATAIGDPPNVLIASDSDIQAGGVTFATFTLHMALCAIFVAIISFMMLRFMFGKMDSTKEKQDILEIEHEIKIWERTAQNLSNVSREEALVRAAIDIKIDELTAELEKKIGKSQVDSSDGWDAPDLAQAFRIRDKWLLLKTGLVLGITIILFFLSNFPMFNLSLGWTSLLGAITLLILADRVEVETIFTRIEWSTLVFFASLFVVMEGLDKLGLLIWIGRQVESVIESVPVDYQLTVAIILIVWVSGLASSFIDNIPFTSMMIPVVKNLSESNKVDLPLQPLVWSLALGSCLGGNGTLIGASANIVCAGISEQHGYKFTFLDFFKIGFPITLASLLVATLYLILCHVALGWNG